MKTNTEIKQYITLSEGLDYRAISKIMTTAGYRMNHATARNILIEAMNNFMDNLASELNIELTEDKKQDMLKDREIHDSLIDILYKSYESLEAEHGKDFIRKEYEV